MVQERQGSLLGTFENTEFIQRDSGFQLMKKNLIDSIWSRLKFYFQPDGASDARAAFLGLLRLILILNSVYIFTLVNAVLAKVPIFSEAIVRSGELVAVNIRGNRGGPHIKVKLDDGVYSMGGNFEDRLRGLEIYVGQVVTVYYYSTPSLFLFKNYSVMDFEVNGSLKIGNWESRREAIIARSADHRSFYIPILILIFTILLFEITLRQGTDE